MTTIQELDEKVVADETWYWQMVWIWTKKKEDWFCVGHKDQISYFCSGTFKLDFAIFKIKNNSFI